ncbi:hypothetical protein HU830_00490 [Lactobacillus sp. DCY120]|uniref:Uncharacterized protein n=1 Tax=Bombilactobacillus apium TaxID=2675299 RepID=A0A850R4C2_9LACO|nr:hypothetical protein [Bombilactobacillus apium]NVY95687.1 hypothetical protein [Bombilactobacillus apium]
MHLKQILTTATVTVIGITTFPEKVQRSNSDPVTAHDFVYGCRRTVDPKTKSQYSYILEGVLNAKEITAGKNPFPA